MFFSSLPILIYVRKNSLEFFTSKSTQKLEFPPSAISNLEVVDKENYQKEIESFFSKFKFKNKKTVIILSDEVIFQKEVPNLEEEKRNLIIQIFSDSVPFEEGNIIKKEITQKEKTLIFATNKDLYRYLQKTLDEMGWSIKNIAPLSLFKYKLNITSNEIDNALVKKILKEKKLLSLGDLLDRNVEEIEDEDEHRSYSVMPLIVIGIIIILASALSLGWMMGLVKNPFPQNESKESAPVAENVKNSDVAESSSSATQKVSSQSASLKDGLSVQVLNGSNVAGQAALIKDQLLSLGFTGNIETGNADSSGSEQTVVLYSDKVTDEIKKEIKTELEKSFVEVIEDSKDAGEFDIIITTGQLTP